MILIDLLRPPGQVKHIQGKALDTLSNVVQHAFNIDVLGGIGVFFVPLELCNRDSAERARRYIRKDCFRFVARFPNSPDVLIVVGEAVTRNQVLVELLIGLKGAGLLAKQAAQNGCTAMFVDDVVYPRLPGHEQHGGPRTGIVWTVAVIEWTAPGRTAGDVTIIHGTSVEWTSVGS